MPRTASTMLPLETSAPNFDLPDVISGDSVSLAKFIDQDALLVVFASPHCPFVQHIKQELTRLSQDYIPLGLGILGISSNDSVQYPDDAPAKVKEFAQAQAFNFPFVFDESQDIAKAYAAACTPDFFLFNGDRRLVYRG